MASEVEDKGLQRQIWIAARTDGKDGIGTQNDPRNGAGPDNFAAVMKSVPSHSETILLPGDYETYGWNSNKEFKSSFMLNTCSRLRGCGMGNTTLKLVGVNEEVSDYYIMLAGLHSSFDRLEVRDLTLDLNFQSNDKAVMMSACHVQGSHVQLTRLRVINAGNKGIRENFLIGLGAGDKAKGWQVDNIEIDDCRIESPQWVGNQSGIMAIQFFGSLDKGETTRRGVIRNCYINGRFHDGHISAYSPTDGNAFEDGRNSMQAIGVGTGCQMIYENNHIENVVNAIYRDDKGGNDFIVRGNTFLNVSVAVGLHYQNPEFTWDRVTIEDNDIALTKTKDLPANPPSGIYLSAHSTDSLPRIKEVIVKNNRINLADFDMDPDNASMAAIYIDHVQQATIEDNTIRLPRSTATPHPLGHIYLNKVGQVRVSNNVRPELGSVISPWRADLKRWV